MLVSTERTKAITPLPGVMLQFTVRLVKFVGAVAEFWQAWTKAIAAPPGVPPVIVWILVKGLPPAGCTKSPEAVTLACKVTTQVEAVVHPEIPVHWLNVQAPPVQEPEGDSVRLMTVPSSKVALHAPDNTPAFELQLIPPTSLVIVPMPCPVPVTVRTKVGIGALKFAATVVAALTVQAPGEAERLHPLKLANVPPLRANAVRVTIVPVVKFTEQIPEGAAGGAIRQLIPPTSDVTRPLPVLVPPLMLKGKVARAVPVPESET